MASSASSITVATCVPQEKHLKLPRREPFRKGIVSQYNFDEGINIKTHETTNQALNTIITAYNYHLGLHLTPDDVMLLIDGIASRYVNEDYKLFASLFTESKEQKKEQLRAYFPEESFPISESELQAKRLAAKDKPKDTDDLTLDDLTIPRDERVWTNLMYQFAVSLNARIKDPTLCAAVMPNFSTTTPLDCVNAAICLMDMAKNYYKYDSTTDCGIPTVHLHGTIDDWIEVKTKTCALGKLFGPLFARYVEKMLIPVLDSIIDTKRGNPNSDFWDHIIDKEIKHGSGGGRFWSGWILNLFPYAYNMSSRNEYPIIGVDDKLNGIGPSINRVPMTYQDPVHGEVNLMIKSGVFGIKQHDDGSVQMLRGYNVSMDRH